jgi:hypothetical protein
VFEGEGGKRYAKAVEGVVASTARAVDECDEGVSGVYKSPMYHLRNGRCSVG